MRAKRGWPAEMSKAAAELIPELRPHYRQRRMDGVVRSSGSAGLDRSDRNARPARRRARSPTQAGRVSARRAALPDRGDRSEPRLAYGCDRSGASRLQRLLRARVLQAARSECRGHASRLDVRVVRSERALASQYLDAAEPCGAGRASRRGDRRDPLTVGDHGASYDPHPEGAGAPGSPQGADHARGIVLADQQRAHGGRLRQHSVHGAQGRLHGDQHGVPGNGRRDQRAPRREAGNGEGGISQAG